MSKNEQILEFLNNMYFLKQRYPNENISEYVYHYLVRLNVPDIKLELKSGIVSQSKFDLSEVGYFDYWVKNFKNAQNTKTYVDPNWSYFCQFVSKNKDDQTFFNHLKVYIPLDAEHIAIGTNKIFEYLNNKDVAHHSKVGKKIRFDDVVVRLFNEKDTKEFLNFLKNNEYIQSGLMEPNPFALSVDGISLAADGRISYNSTVASLVALYIEEKYKNPNNVYISTENFYSFVEDYFENVFIKKNVADEKIANDFLSDKEKQYFMNNPSYRNDIKKDYQNVIALIINSHDPQFSLEDYFKHVDTIQEGKVATIKGQEGSIVDEQQVAIDDSVVNDLRNYIEICSSKYSKAESFEIFYNYIYSGNAQVITREGNLRAKVIASNFSERCKEYMKLKNITFGQLFDLSLGTQSKSNVDISTYINDAFRETLKKYDKNQLAYAIMSLVTNGNYNCFTRENNTRENLIANATPEDFYKYVKSYGIITTQINYNMLDTYIESFIKSNER